MPSEHVQKRRQRRRGSGVLHMVRSPCNSPFWHEDNIPEDGTDDVVALLGCALMSSSAFKSLAMTTRRDTRSPSALRSRESKKLFVLLHSEKGNVEVAYHVDSLEPGCADCMALRERSGANGSALPTLGQAIRWMCSLTVHALFFARPT